MNRKRQRKLYGKAFARFMLQKHPGAYDTYIAWRRLTNNGRRTRDQMSPESQAEYDSYGFKRVPPSTPEEQAEAKRLYDAAP